MLRMLSAAIVLATVGVGGQASAQSGCQPTITQPCATAPDKRAAEKPGDIVTHRHAQGVQPEDRHHHQFTNEDKGCDEDNHLHQVAEMPSVAACRLSFQAS